MTLPVYVQATNPGTDVQNAGTAALCLMIQFSDPHYIWTWGDKTAATDTTKTGGTYADSLTSPGNAVAHKYTTARDYTVTLTVVWHVTYQVAPGAPWIFYDNVPQVDNPPQTFVAHIVEAHALLVG